MARRYRRGPALRSFSSWCIAGFLAMVPVLLCVCGWVNRSIHRSEVQAVARLLPSGSSVASVVDAKEAKAEGLFWLLEPNHGGVAIRLRSDASWFDSVFPSYEAVRSDEGFWRSYFQSEFMTISVSPLFSSGTFSGVMTSWAGNMGLYSLQGADIVLLGSSEVFHAVIPGFLRDLLVRSNGPAWRGAKVLSLGMANMSVGSVARAAQAASGTRRKARVAVWGYSLCNAYLGRPDLADNDKDFNKALAAWRSGGAGPAPRSWEWGKGPGWEGFEPLSLQSLWEKRRGWRHRERTVPDGVAKDPRRLAEAAAGMKPFESSLRGVSEKDCDLGQASRELDRAIEAILSFADGLVLYAPAVTPLQTDHAPACLVSGVRKMLESKAGPRVLVRTGDWRSYGFDWTDFLKPSNRPGFWWIDANHPDYPAAERFTGKVADWILRLPGPGKGR